MLLFVKNLDIQPKCAKHLGMVMKISKLRWRIEHKLKHETKRIGLLAENQGNGVS